MPALRTKVNSAVAPVPTVQKCRDRSAYTDHIDQGRVRADDLVKTDEIVAIVEGDITGDIVDSHDGRIPALAELPMTYTSPTATVPVKARLTGAGCVPAIAPLLPSFEDVIGHVDGAPVPL
jgi:hypothetical protein